MLDEIERALAKAEGFAEIRASRSWQNRVLVRGKEVDSVVAGGMEGLGVRVLLKGAWGFAASNDLGDIASVVERATRLAKAAGRKPIEAELADTTPAKASVHTRVKKHPSSVHIDDKARRCIELGKRALADKAIRTVDVSYGDSWGEWWFANSDGARIDYEPVRSVFAVEAYTKGAELFRSNERDAGLVGYEILDSPEHLVDDAVSNAKLLLKSELPPKGEMPVVVDPRMAGVLAHEAVGHACEADAVLNTRSILGDKLGKRIGSEHVSIVDDPTLPRCYGSYPFDAEGTPAQRKVLVDHGVLRSFLHSRETAAKLGQKPTGNARAESSLAFPLVRMSNTLFEKGDQSLEELLEPIKRGVFVSGMKGGVTEPANGFFQFAADYGRLIEDGELTKPLRDVTLVGNIMTTLNLVSACGKAVRIGNPGMCGKAGQMVPVSDGGPHIRIDRILVGG